MSGFDRAPGVDKPCPDELADPLGGAFWLGAAGLLTFAALVACGAFLPI